MASLQELFGEAIYAYTREQAIEDGTLVDVSGIAREAGFKIPVAITSAVNGLIENIPECKSWQDYQGRLWDVLNMARWAARVNSSKSQFLYGLSLAHIERKEVYYKPKMDVAKGIYKEGYFKEKNVLVENTTLKVMIHAGDNGEPVITIMLPSED
jgi:hypothetical protein